MVWFYSPAFYYNIKTNAFGLVKDKSAKTSNVDKYRRQKVVSGPAPLVGQDGVEILMLGVCVIFKQA